MPAHNYPKIAQNKKALLLNDPKISQVNKEAIIRFLKAYNVTDARLGLFCDNIKYVLRDTVNIMQDMNNRDKINSIFYKYRVEQPNLYGTVVNVSNALVRWLNNGIKPNGFIDIKHVSKNNQMRKLDPSDMVTWEDAKTASNTTNNLQNKTMILMQLDAGFRPSEFCDLNYSDISTMKDIVLVRVKSGKTGQRNVFLYRSAAAMQRWLINHPLKQKDSPLWLMEKKNQQVRCSYPAILKRMKTMFSKAQIKKPYDLYNLRHSSCVLDKKDNLPLELAAERHGHSTAYFTKVYGRLSCDDVADRYRSHYGGITEHQQKEHNRVCERCSCVNEPLAEYCQQCSAPLTLAVAMKNMESNTERIAREVITLLQTKGLNREILKNAIALKKQSLKI